MGRRLKRGEIWWVDFGEPRGSEPAFRRPVVIVQDDLLTESQLGTVMVVPLTTNLRRGLAIGNVEIPARHSRLPKPSVALVCQIASVDKSLFAERVSSLPQRTLVEQNRGMALALSLGELRA
jgi:mRNA interferase MazF